MVRERYMSSCTNGRRHRLKQRAPHREDFAVGGHDGSTQAFRRLEGGFVAPVGGLAAAGLTLRIFKDQLAPGDPAHLGVGEVAHQAAHAAGGVDGVGVREHENVASRLGNGAIEGGSLAFTLGAVEHTDSVTGELPCNRDGRVGGAVRGDNDVEFLFRIVERQGVVKFLPDHLLFVVRGDDERDRGLKGGLAHRPGSK